MPHVSPIYLPPRKYDESACSAQRKKATRKRAADHIKKGIMTIMIPISCAYNIRKEYNIEVKKIFFFVFLLLKNILYV